MKSNLLAVFLIFFIAAGIAAADYGVLLNGELDVQGADKTKPKGNIVFAPWVSVPYSSSDLYISAGLNTSLAKDNYAALELFRFEYTYRGSPFVLFRLGRINWQDVSCFVAKGRFDGADFLYNLGKIRLGFNALYTGFLFKDTAYINVSPDDTKDYTVSFNWSDFGSTYFAPGRLITSLYGEFPGFPVGRGRLFASILAQFDLSGADEAYHTQYLLARYILGYKAFDLDAAGAVELTKTGENGVKPAFAFSLEGGWQLPTAITDRISIKLAWASGEGSKTAAFFPITMEAMSFVLGPAFSGMMNIQVNYNVRLLPSFSAELGGLYFIRTDSKSFIAPYLESSSYPLGLELNTSLLWVPFSDLALTLKGGFFLPGPAWADDAPVLWRLTLGTMLSF